MGTKSTLNDADRRQLVIDHIDVAEKVARAFHRRLPSHVLLDDMRSAAHLGLIDAAERYDPSGGKSFADFAAYRMRGAMADELRENDTQSRGVRMRSNDFAKLSREYQAALGREPTDDEIASRLGLPLKKVRAQQRYMLASSIVSLEHEVPIGKGRPDKLRIGDRLADTAHATGLDSAMRRERCEMLERAVSKLPPRLQQTLALYFCDDMNLREVSDIFDITESRACQILHEATKRLREEYLALGGTA